MKKNKNSGKVFVVVALDTEGPILDKKKLDIISDWKNTEKLIKLVTSSKFRNFFKDSENKGIVYSWFILTLTGFKTNPFKRPMRYHETYDFYLKKFKKNFLRNNDGIYWHNHQPAKSGIGNEWSNDWFSSNEYLNILNKLVVDRSFFPSCFRAGGRIEDNNLSHWLEEYIPFDYSNCSGEIDWDRIESDGKKLREVADWSSASTLWKGYRPSHKNYQDKGKMRRHIFRSVDCNSPVYEIKEKDIFEAFSLADKGDNAVLSIFEHDRRFSLIENIQDFTNKLKKISKEFKHIKFYFKNAQDASNLSLNLKVKKAPIFKIKICDDRRILISCKDQIFGSRPYACVKFKDKLSEVPLNKVGKSHWLTSSFKKNTSFDLFVVANNNSGYNKVTKKKINLI